MISIKSAREIELMREAGHLNYLTHEELAKHIKPGISTKELDVLATEKQTYEGYLYYKVDSDIKDVYVSFENVTISIPDFRNKIK